MKTVHCIAVATTVLLGAWAQSARSVDVLNRPITNAAGNCQSALPVYDTNIRKRPLAVVNEGTVASFVTCALTTDDSSLGVIEYQTVVRNQSQTAMAIDCMAVTGEETSATYYPKSITLNPGQRGTISWLAVDNGGLVYENPVSLSCLLPPGGALNENKSLYLLQIL